MRLLTTTLRDFLSHESTDLSFGDARLIAFVGPNGAGKSSAASDALEFALFGRCRGRTDALVRLGSSEMSVVCTFELDGSTYRVARGRTLRSGGKPFLELAIADGVGGWRPLSGASTAETQASIESVLRMDDGMFRAAVLLGQGDSHRFARSTPGERKAILAQAVLDPRFDVAAGLSKAERTAIEATVQERTTRLARLDERLADRSAHEDARGHWTVVLAGLDEQQATAEGHRSAAEVALRDVAGRLAIADAAVADVARLRAERRTLQERYVAVEASGKEAAARLQRARDAQVEAPAIAAASAAVGPLRERVAAAERVEAAVRQRQSELDHWQDRLRAAEREHQQRLAAWQSGRAGLASRIHTLEERLESLRPITCRRCGNVQPADTDGLAVDLVVARQALEGHGPEPGASMELMKAEGQARLVMDKIRELAFDAGTLARLRGELGSMERTAARAGELAAVREAEAAAAAAIKVADAELETITATGTALSATIGAAEARIAEAAELRALQARHEQVVAAAAVALAGVARQRGEAQSSLGRVDAAIAELAAVQVERDGIEGSVKAAAAERERLAKLERAFGPNGIPARVIESVLPELEDHANAILGQLRPGMTLGIRSQRARKGGQGMVEALDLVVRDEQGERDLGMYSGGEQMSVSLSLAVGLSRLVARRAGAAIRTLVLDEPDSLDADSRRSLGQALRVLAHEGELDRVVLITHHEDLAEIADMVVSVRKVDGRSRIEVDGVPAVSGELAEAA